ncbi:lysosome-associated membrane glycoprotein 3 isoform X2 [Sparus aurata]|uniref:Lysosome-associated membrane glycoprotein 2-like luminal domain-containing protein n=1 Tax=Sparus aurata TaxID=8175 RepID=A0A671TQU2_SPAAU|nr:lysosome-associated membrane glycoprotein 3 isoform X2 [Sparus aurata]
MVLGSLLLLAVLLPGVHLKRNDASFQPPSDSERPSEAQIYRPVLQHSESIPPIGTYMLKNKLGKPCIKATVGVEYIITEKKMWYFSLDPSRVVTSGRCDDGEAVLSLTLPDNAASLLLYFKKEKSLFYVTKMMAHVSPLPVCKGCPNKTYQGLVDHEKLFKTADGRSFKCKSENLLLMSSQLQIKLVPVQMQAFTLSRGQYGKEIECWADFNKRVIPIIIGATVVGLILIAGLTYLFIKDRRRQGYDSL